MGHYKNDFILHNNVKIDIVIYYNFNYLDLWCLKSHCEKGASIFSDI